MIFNPDISKQAQEVIASRKTDKVNHMPLTFNAIPGAQTTPWFVSWWEIKP